MEGDKIFQTKEEGHGDSHISQKLIVDHVGGRSPPPQPMFPQLDFDLHRMILYMCDTQTVRNLMKTCKYMESMIMMDVCLLKRLYGEMRYVRSASFHALHRNNMDWLRYACETCDYKTEDSHDIEVESARIGNLEALTYLHEFNEKLFKQRRGEITNTTVPFSIHIPYLVLICRNKADVPYLVNALNTLERNFHRNVCRATASNGHLLCLQYLISVGYELDESVYEASEIYSTKTENFDCPTYLTSVGCPKTYIAPPEEVFNAIVDDDKKKLRAILRELHKIGNQFCNLSALLGRLKCLKSLRKFGCGWDSTTCEACAEGGHVDCLEFVQDRKSVV